MAILSVSDLPAVDRMGWRFPNTVPTRKSTGARISGLGDFDQLGRMRQDAGNLRGLGADEAGPGYTYDAFGDIVANENADAVFAQEMILAASPPGGGGSMTASTPSNTAIWQTDQSAQYKTGMPDSSSSWDWGKIATGIATGVSQFQLNQINLERAQRGLPPLSSSAVAPQVNVGLSPQVKQMLIYAALGLGAYLLLARKPAR